MLFRSLVVLTAMRKLYKVDDSYTDAQARLIVGVRYELDGRSSYTFAEDVSTELLGRIVESGTRSVLFSTHITSDLEKCASHIAFIKDGVMQYSGAMGDFRAQYRDMGDTLEDIIVKVERRPLDESAII